MYGLKINGMPLSHFYFYLTSSTMLLLHASRAIHICHKSRKDGEDMRLTRRYKMI